MDLPLDSSVVSGKGTEYPVLGINKSSFCDLTRSFRKKSRTTSLFTKKWKAIAQCGIHRPFRYQRRVNS